MARLNFTRWATVTGGDPGTGDPMTTTPAPAPTTPTSDTTSPTYHFVCCDVAYCRIPVEDAPLTDITGEDVPCQVCVDLALRAHCPECGLLYP